MNRTRSDRGSATLFVVISAIGLLALIGLIADGGARVRAVQRADALAAEAARAGGQAIDIPQAIAGNGPTVDREAAARAARAYLTSSDVSGTVGIADAGRTLTVTVTTRQRTVFLGVIGISSMTANGEASATLVHGVTGPLP